MVVKMIKNSAFNFEHLVCLGALRCQYTEGLGELVGPWCAAIRRLRDGVEKEHAFGGMCRCMQLNPGAGVRWWRNLHPS